MTVQRADDLIGFHAVTVDLFLTVHAAAERNLSVRKKQPRSPVRYIREPGTRIEGSGRKRAAVFSGLLRYPRATLAPAI
jgi:hypothetical protein